MNIFKALSVLPIISLLTLFGCAEIQFNCEDSNYSEILIGVDTSGSSKQFSKNYHQSLSRFLIDQSPTTHITLFRFDCNTAEVYDGNPPETLEQSSMLLKRVLTHSTDTKGTNLNELFKAFDKSIVKNNFQCLLKIYTDCGVEELTNSDLDNCKILIKNWDENHKVSTIQFSGLQDGNRELLRKICDSKNIKLVFEEE